MMHARLARTWLRQIALGLPMMGGVLVSAACGSSTTVGGDGGVVDAAPTRTEDAGNRCQQFSATVRQVSSIPDSGVSTADASSNWVNPSSSAVCNEICGDWFDERRQAAIDCGHIYLGSEGVASCSVESSTTVRCSFIAGAVAGRRPTDFETTRASHELPRELVAAWLTEVAELEAAAVTAFDDIDAELRRFGAPDALLADVARARADEVRHTDVMGRLAAEHGGAPRPFDRGAHASPRASSLFDFARTNTIEGCVREALAALVAAHQAETASDPAIREALTAIARDEAEHALLSFAIDGWARAQLTEDERAQLDLAHRETLESIVRDVQLREAPADVRAVLGLPSADEERVLALALA